MRMTFEAAPSGIGLKKAFRQLFAVGAVALLTSHANAAPIERDQFVEIDPPTDAVQLDCANNDEHSWHVEYSANNLVISEARFAPQGEPAPPALKAKLAALAEKFVPTFSGIKKLKDQHPILSHPPSAFLRIDKGWMVGFDAGEFGGGLWWLGDDNDEAYSLDYLNVHHISESNGEIVVASGLAHLNGDEGRILAFKPKSEGPPERVNVLKAPSAIEAFLQTDFGYIAATQIGPLHINADKIVTYDGSGSGFGRHLIYPNSIAADEDGNIYIGARYAVLVYRNLPNDFSPKWLAPKSCVRFIADRSNGQCPCVSAD